MERKRIPPDRTWLTTSVYFFPVSFNNHTNMSDESIVFKTGCGFLGFGAKTATTDELNKWCDAQSTVSSKYDDLSARYDDLSAKYDDLSNEYDDLNAKHLKFRNVVLSWKHESSFGQICEKLGDEYCDTHPFCSLNDENKCKPRDEYNVEKNEKRWERDLILNAPICDVPPEACHLLSENDACKVIDGKCQLNPWIMDK